MKYSFYILFFGSILCCQNIDKSNITKDSWSADTSKQIIEIFDPVEPQPYLESCKDVKDKNLCTNKMLLDYIYSNLSFQNLELDDIQSSRIVVSFLIKANGSIDNISIKYGREIASKSNIVDVIEQMPPWRTIEINGVKSDYIYNLPLRINFDTN